MVADIIATGAVLMMAMIYFLITSSKLNAKETQIVAAGYVYHMAFSVLIVLITSYFYGGDMIGYHRFGTKYASLMHENFAYYAPEVTRMLLKQKTYEVPFTFAGSSTGAMQAIATWLMFFLGGSLYAASMFFAMATFAAKMAMYNVFKSMFPRTYHTKLQLGFIFLPSVAFWASGMLKESVAFVGMGPVFWGGSKLLRKQQVIRASLGLALGLGMISLVKAYILFPLFFAGGVTFYWYRSLKRYGKVNIIQRPWQLAIAAILTIGAVLGLGEVFPKYSLNNIGKEAANLQYYGVRRGNTRSNYSVGNYQEKSLTGQMAYMPVGLLYSLFRPLPFEIRNAAMALNVLEMMLLLLLWIRVLMARPPPKTMNIILSHPLLMFCLVFVVLFGASVGIATTNVGTLSRYRMPMMPFYAVILLVLEHNPKRKTRKRRRAPVRRPLG